MREGDEGEWVPTPEEIKNMAFRAAQRERLIVSRHPAVAEWLIGVDSRWDGAPVKASVTPADVENKVVAGPLPPDLASLTREWWAILFTVPPRGAELSVEEMRAAGARLQRFVVRTAEAADATEKAAWQSGFNSAFTERGLCPVHRQRVDPDSGVCGVCVSSFREDA